MLVIAGLMVLAVLVLQPVAIFEFRKYIAVLFPKGIIGVEQRNLLFVIQALMLLVIVPVYILTFVFSWKYRVDNKKSVYDPDLVDHTIAEYIWWGFPFIITLIIGVYTVIKTYELDPYRPIASDKKPLKIQVVSLQWKWLFLYPEEKIASTNFIQIPIHTPIHFEITSDAPMNSLWIPHLGGQIYAMPRMKTNLHLIANDMGDFRGSSANLSGAGFAEMHFITRSSSQEEFDKWIEKAKNSENTLDFKSYEKLAAPSKKNSPTLYKLEEENLFDKVIQKYTHPKSKE